MDFDVEIFKLPDQNSTAIKITANNGKTNITVIKNREVESDTKSLVSQTVFKLVCATTKEIVKEKMEEKCIELSTRTGRPRTLKRNISEEQRQKERKSDLDRYYKRKYVAVN
jgi:hypothetical protein